MTIKEYLYDYTIEHINTFQEKLNNFNGNLSEQPEVLTKYNIYIRNYKDIKIH